ncbi:MAG: DUF367 family protein [Candidatus Lokiarchaeota archaeon]|nr:DUF367 family protein [Candidatus Lokiarchaeota archaeon]MBD3201038.1 DUF367 family protein [Candidatus Lokiarchaeota archaeon]
MINYPKKFVNLYCLHYGECDPNKCTSIKLKNLNLIKFIRKISGKLKNCILLNPFSDQEISNKDAKIVKNYGIIVIDCSWKNILKFNKISNINSRRLPSLIAANPVNYGKWEKLSSIEALSSTLFLTGFVEQARFILSKFSWGPEFLKINQKLLEKKKNI